ncbi:MAG: sulfite exporter TauE/SafE family protein [Pseudomonadota bacterium]|nr:sulfite exporter TauE/SafE family protein [Pseudomonadota bacterium]
MTELMTFLTEGTGLTIVGFLFLCGISCVGSFIAASLGLGGGLLVLATMTLFLPPTVLIPIHAIVQIGSNGFRSFLMRRDIVYSLIPAFVFGTLLGSWLGGFTVFSLETWVLQAVLGIFVLYATWAPKFRSTDPGPLKFFGCGVFGGFVTMFVGGTGPLVAPFVNAACKRRQQVVATHGSMMTFQHLFKVVVFGFLGFSFGPYIPLLVGLIAAGICGTFFGRTVLNRLPEKVFRISIQTILTLLALRLLFEATKSFIE